MKKIKHPKFLLFIAFMALTALFVIATFTMIDDDAATITTTEASQPDTEISFDPSSFISEGSEEEVVEVFINPNVEGPEVIDYVNIKIQYDPQKLEVTEIAKGEFPGVYQNSILVDQDYEPVGLLSVLWIPQPGGADLREKSSIAKINMRTLTNSPQGMNITNLTDPNDWRSNIVLTENKTYIDIVSDGLSINGGSTKLESTAVDYYCNRKCGNGQMCIDGQCEMLAAVQRSNLSLVLGASSDGSVEKIAISSGDINLDGVVNTGDISLLLSDIIACEEERVCNERSDLNGDGQVSTSDYYLFIREY